MIPPVKDMPFDPISMLDNLNTSDPRRSGDGAGRDWRTDLGNGLGASAPACL
jgi:hypothetical protein